ncbi:MAG: hypothetical protein WC455_26865 [Dehalococcoidia bacterium]
MSKSKTIIRAPRSSEHPYFVCRRAAAQDESLSWEARGVLWYLLSKPDDWQVQPVNLEQHCGRQKVYRILKELKSAGYLVQPEQGHKQEGDVRGQFEPSVYIVHEAPQETIENEPRDEKPCTPLPCTPNHHGNTYKENNTTELPEIEEKELAGTPNGAQSGESSTDQKSIEEPVPTKPIAPEDFKPIQELVITHWFKGDWANAGWAGDIANLFLGRSEAKQYIEYNFAPAFSVAEFTAFCSWLKGLGFALPTKPEKLRRYGMQYRDEHKSKPASTDTALSEDQMAALRREQFTMPDVLKGVSQS